MVSFIEVWDGRYHRPLNRYVDVGREVKNVRSRWYPEMK